MLAVATILVAAQPDITYCYGLQSCMKGVVYTDNTAIIHVRHTDVAQMYIWMMKPEDI